MKVSIKRIDAELPLPVYESVGAVGFDFVAREETVVAAKSLGLIPANVVVEVPAGYMLVIASRSSAPKKKGLLTPHGVGIIDHDYCGPSDEIKVQVYNFRGETVVIARGEKIAQGVFVRIDKFEFEEVAEMKRESRGGFGSTGGYHEDGTQREIAP